MATSMVWVWKSPAFGEFRVTVETVSVGGTATLVKFTRNARFRPAEAGNDGTMWVLTSQIHRVNPKAEAVAKRTAETLGGKLPKPALPIAGVTLAALPKAPTGTRKRNAVGTEPMVSTRSGKLAPQFKSF
jgi:hypothetical protein